MVEIRRIDSVDGFLAAAGAFLAAREAEHNLLLGICSGLQAIAAGDAAPDEPTPVFFVATSGDRLVLAAVRTPPYNLVLSEVDDGTAVDALAEELAGDDLPGVLGPAEHAAAFATRWGPANGRTPRLAMSERIFRLTSVRMPPLPPGCLRPATVVDRPLVVEWYEAFGQEALPGAPLANIERQVDRRMAEGGIYLWHRDAPVSMAVAGSRTPNGSRVGPVYTPPERRRQGYASACVAAVSQAQLDAGRSFVFLFTDLANPTANHIYREIGFEPVRDVESWLFEEPARFSAISRHPAPRAPEPSPRARPASVARAGSRSA
jgi:predicted GNAT family acetyltransferase